MGKTNNNWRRSFDYSRWTGGPNLLRPKGLMQTRSTGPTFEDLCGGRVPNRTTAIQARALLCAHDWAYKPALEAARAQAVSCVNNDYLGFERYLFSDASVLVFKTLMQEVLWVDATDSMSIKRHCGTCGFSASEVHYFASAINVLKGQVL